MLDLPGRNEGLFALDAEARRHWLRVFALVFRPQAFLPGEADPRSFHARAIEEGRLYEAEVAKDLSGLVFGEAFPTLARAFAGAAPDPPLEEVREAALVLLYRLMFVLYSEDRGLLPLQPVSRARMRPSAPGSCQPLKGAPFLSAPGFRVRIGTYHGS